MLAIGELYMVGLPKFKFDLLSWRIFDPFINYGHVMMLHTMKNLVANDLLLCSERKHIELRLNDISLDSPLGLVEEIILKEVAADPGCSVKDCMRASFAKLLDDESDVNPGKYMLANIIRANRFDYWEWTESEGWFSHKIEISIRPSSIGEMNKQLAASSSKINASVNQNPVLPFYFEEFSKVIGREFGWWTTSA